MKNVRASVLTAATAILSMSIAGVAFQTPQKTVKDKVYTKEQAARGETQYGKMCASCHDPEKVAAGKKPAPPVVGDKFLAKWDGKSLGELLTTIETTMPNDGSAVLSDDETVDLTAYILKANNFPDGATPLKVGAASNDIVIVK